MNIFRHFCIFCIAVFSLISVSESFASSYTYTPAATIYMTGQSLSGGVVQARFDVAKALADSGSSFSAPLFNTGSKSFSGVFYLSGAWWVDMAGVNLDCGIQSLSSLSTPCTLSGSAQSETIGDVIFDGNTQKIQYLPSSGTLSWSISTNIGNFTLSGVFLPLLHAEFTDMSNSGVVDKAKSLSIKNPGMYMSSGSLWKVQFIPIGTTYWPINNSVDGSFILDISLASQYDILITDPNGSTTKYSGYYTANSDIPSITHTDADFIKNFCSPTPIDNSRCPDGSNLSTTTLSKVPSSSLVVWDGSSSYNFTLKLRDKYWNLVKQWNIKIAYKTTADIDQTILWENDYYSPVLYIGYGIHFSQWGFSSSSSPEDITSLPILLSGTDITYAISSDAPTDSSDNTLSLSGITYTDRQWVQTNIPNLDKTPLIFSPWFTSKINNDTPILVGKDHIFTTTDNTPTTSNVTMKKIYGIFVWDNFGASFDNLNGIPNPVCSKNYDVPVDSLTPTECAWSMMNSRNFPAVISTTASSFSGTYTPHTIDPDLEDVSYVSYITYDINGNTVIYPSFSGSLGTSIYNNSAVKIIGQNNVGKQYDGIESKNNSAKWNALHEQTMKLSRNRTDYSDVNYTVIDHPTIDQSVDDSFFTSGNPKKRTLIVVWKDITITWNIFRQDHPLAIIALADKDGNGGNITIDPGVTDISASLFAEHALLSSGNNQLFILGSVVSRNTIWETAAKICPFFVNTSCDESTAKKYDLEKLHEWYTSSSPRATSSDAAPYPDISLIIEYDGRVQMDPPPGF